MSDRIRGEMLLNTLVAQVIREREKDHSLVKHEIFMGDFAGNRVDGVVESKLAIDVIFLDQIAKVRNGFGGCDLIQVAIRPDVRMVKGKMSNKNLTALRQWVKLNHDMIVKYWDCNPMIMGSLDVYDAVKSLPLKGKAKRLASEGGYVRSEELLRALKPVLRQG